MVWTYIWFFYSNVFYIVYHKKIIHRVGSKYSINIFHNIFYSSNLYKLTVKYNSIIFIVGQGYQEIKIKYYTTEIYNLYHTLINYCMLLKYENIKTKVLAIIK